MEKIKVILVPDERQRQIIFNTMERYSEMCNYISRIVFEREVKNPRNLYYWVIDNYDQNFYDNIRYHFRDMNTCLIPLALRKVAKAYKNNWPIEAHQFSDILDCSNGTVTIKHVMPSPNNIGFLTISMLGGRQAMHFVFDDNQRRELSVAFNRKKFRDYELTFQDNQFCLITDVYDQKKDRVNVGPLSITDQRMNKILKEYSTECRTPRYKHKLNASL